MYATVIVSLEELKAAEAELPLQQSVVSPAPRTQVSFAEPVMPVAPEGVVMKSCIRGHKPGTIAVGTYVAGRIDRWHPPASFPKLRLALPPCISEVWQSWTTAISIAW